jgi:flagellar assembly protein FliH
MATVIKAHEQNPQLVRRLETVNVADHLGEARDVLAQARAHAERMLREAEQRATQAREQASREGYEAGFRRGYDTGKQSGYDEAFAKATAQFTTEQATLVDALAQVIAGFDAQKRDLLIAARQDVVRFAARLAEKVTHQLGATAPEAAVANTEAALKLLAGQSDVVITVHPQDRAALERFAADLAGQMEGSPHWTIAEDAGLAPGGCRVTGATGAVDASLETQLARIVDLMVPAEEADA